jgi:hypothetical protein
MRIRPLHLLLALFFSFAAANVQAQKLDQAREEVRGGGDSGSKDDGDSSGSDQAPYWGDGTDVGDYQTASACPPDDPDCGESDALEILFGYGLGFAFWLPHTVAEGEEPRAGWFPGYPYRGKNKGYMVFSEVARPVPQVETTSDGDLLIGEGDELIMPQPERTSPVALRIAAEYSHDLETVYKPWANLLLSTRWRFGLESGWTWYVEDLGTGELDQLTIGDANLIFRFAQHEHVQMRTGAGVRLMIDREAVDAGFNWTYGFDLFPAQPLIFSSSVDLGSLGRAFFVHFRAHIGIGIWALEVYAGWDLTHIAGVDSSGRLTDGVTFHGPMLGLRSWF